MFGNRLYAAAVIVFWLAAMSWLVTDRILPPFFDGDAPRMRLSHQTEPVAWRIEMEGSPCGTAVLQAVAGDSGTREVHSRIQLDRLKAPESAPLWLRPILKPLKSLSLEMRTTTFYDPLDRISSFTTQLQVSEVDTPISLRGRIAGETLKLRIRVGDFDKDFEHAWPGDAARGGDLTPSPRLLPLYEGRTWRQPVYSPLAPPNEPFEVLEAVVTERLRIDHADEAALGWAVEYRTSEKTGRSDKGRLRAKLLVARDGRVLQQEAYFFGSSVTFIRESDEESRRLAEEQLELAKYATIAPPSEAFPAASGKPATNDQGKATTAAPGSL